MKRLLSHLLAEGAPAVAAAAALLLVAARASAATDAAGPAAPAPAPAPAEPAAAPAEPTTAPAEPTTAPAGPGPAAAPTPARAPMHLRVAPARDSYEGPPLLLGNGKKVRVGAYAGIGGAYTRMMGQDSGLVSFEAALLLDHRLSLGVAGYGFTRTPRGPATEAGTKQQFGAGYGGLAIRYSVFGGLPVYGTFGVVLGAGAVNLHRDYGWDGESSWGDDFGRDDRADRNWDAGRFDTFLMVQPEIALNANLTRWLRLGATVGYRFTGGVGRFGLSESDLNGIVAGGNIQLGWF